ncbi:hypothetical protein PRJ39_10455 [Lysobacter enzymogenes]|uniref:hypothetical protein n=1 Tax=Lysobacter enzymogenes TaxID=69 RepID=UPI003748F898
MSGDDSAPADAVADAELIAAIRQRLAGRGSLWINQRYWHQGEPAQREYFLKPARRGAVDGAILLGFDDWQDRHEDAVDLYLSYRRLSFDTLAQALAYTFAQLPLRPHDLRAAAARG